MLESPLLKKIKGLRIRRKKEIEPQEVFLDQLAKSRFEVPLSGKILKGLFLFFLVLFLILFFRAFQFQVLENQKYSALAEQNKFILKSLNASRGVIYDSRGKQLVFNKISFDLVLDKNELPENEEEKTKVLKEAAEIVKEDYHDLENKEVILKDINHQTLILLETKINDLPGFKIEQNYLRYYPEGREFSHLLGYTGKTSAEKYVGREGLEKSYEEILKKNPGEVRVEKDAQGNLLSKQTVSLPESGKSLVLWLDSELQTKINQVLEETLKRVGAEKAVGLALNPKTGGVLALVSIPGYDNNLFSSDSDQEALKNLLNDPQNPLFNRAISGLYPTGSTVKPLIAAAALEEKIISPTKKINCQGEIIIPHQYDPEIIYVRKDWRVHGLTDMRKAIAESCNVYFYTIGGGYKEQTGLGPTLIKKYLELFGWGSKTGIDVPGEAKGLIPDPAWKKEVKEEDWWDGDTYNLAIGQGDISVSPLQVASAFVAVANNGTLFQPQIVKEIVDSEKNLVEEIKPEILRENFISPENLQAVREGMRQAVTGENSPYASSVLLNSLPAAAAAKTGTAQTALPNYYHNWVTVFAPYDNPQIVLTIMVENVKEGMSVVLPAAKEILEWYFNR